MRLNLVFYGKDKLLSMEQVIREKEKREKKKKKERSFSMLLLLE